MRLLSISSMEEANAWLPKYIKAHNDKFAHAALDPKDQHRALDISDERLDRTLSNQETRKLYKNLEVQYKTVTYQVQRPGTGYGLRHAQVIVCEGTDGTITIHKGEEVLQYKTIGKSLHKAEHKAEVVDRKEVNALLDSKLIKRAIDKQLARVDADIPFAFQVPGSSAFGLQSQSRTLVYAPSTSPLAFLPVFLKCFGYSYVATVNAQRFSSINDIRLGSIELR